MKNKKINKMYWCQCLDINKNIADKIRRYSKVKDTGKICSKCGYKIIKDEKK